MASTVKVEPENISDLIFSEGAGQLSRELRTIVAADRETLKVGDLLELSGSEVTKLATVANVMGVCLSSPPLNLKAAVGFLDIATQPTDTDDTIIIGTQTYRFMTALAAEDDILIGGSAAAALVNLIAAINNTVGSGTEWHASTAKNTQVHAVKISATRMKLISIVGDASGNAIATTETLTATADGFDAAVLSGGEGTVPTQCVTIERHAVVHKPTLNYFGVVEATADTNLRALHIIPRAEPTTTSTQTL